MAKDRSCSESEKAALREARMIEDFLDELAGIAHRFSRWFIDPMCGIRASKGSRQFCPLSAVWYIRTGGKEHFTGSGHLELLLEKMDRELRADDVRFAAVSLRIAEAIDDPFGRKHDANTELGRKLMRAVGIPIQRDP